MSGKHYRSILETLDNYLLEAITEKNVGKHPWILLIPSAKNVVAHGDVHV